MRSLSVTPPIVCAVKLAVTHAEISDKADDPPELTPLIHTIRGVGDTLRLPPERDAPPDREAP